MENKKTKLTISGSSKKSFKEFGINRDIKNKSKKTVVIDKKNNRPYNKPSGFKSQQTNNLKGGTSFKSNFPGKISSPTSDFERRKLAEQRATKRLKTNVDNKEKKNKDRISKKRVEINCFKSFE